MLRALNGAKHLLTGIPSLNAMCRGASAARPAKEWPRDGAKIELRGDQQIVGDDNAATASSTTAVRRLLVPTHTEDQRSGRRRYLKDSVGSYKPSNSKGLRTRHPWKISALRRRNQVAASELPLCACEPAGGRVCGSDGGWGGQGMIAVGDWPKGGFDDSFHQLPLSFPSFHGEPCGPIARPPNG
jgi:hypothetical protein